MHWVVIPFRGAATGKSRLSSDLSEAARRQVALALFQHVLNVACGVAGPQHVLVVTPSSSASKTARRAGAQVLRETSPGHNEAIAQACAHLRARGASTAAIVAADLPLLEATDVELLTRCARSGAIGLAPDRAGAGTNAIALPLGVPFQFHFGSESLREHHRQARRQIGTCRFVRQEGLASDLDTASDLDLLGHPGALSTLPAFGQASYRGLR